MAQRDADAGGEAGGPMQRPEPRRVPIDWDELGIALRWHSDEYDYYLDLKTGRVLAHTIWGAEEDGELTEEQVDDGLGQGRLVPVERLESSVEYGWMAEFAASVADARLRELLDVALDGPGAFRRFKDVLAGHPAERERWFAFRDARLREAVLGWLEDQGIQPTTALPGGCQ